MRRTGRGEGAESNLHQLRHLAPSGSAGAAAHRGQQRALRVLLAAALSATACGGPEVVTDFASLRPEAAAEQKQRLEVRGTLTWCMGASIAILEDAAGKRVALVDEDAMVSGEEVLTLLASAGSSTPQEGVQWWRPGGEQRVSAVGVYSGAGLVSGLRPDFSLVPVLVVDRIDFESCGDVPPVSS